MAALILAALMIFAGHYVPGQMIFAAHFGLVPMRAVPQTDGALSREVRCF